MTYRPLVVSNDHQKLADAIKAGHALGVEEMVICVTDDDAIRFLKRDGKVSAIFITKPPSVLLASEVRRLGLPLVELG